jgi:hypothetical protein
MKQRQQPVSGQQKPKSSKARVNTITAGGQLDPAVATLSDGSYVVTWRSDGRNGWQNVG